MVNSDPLILSSLLKSLEALYPILFNLTVKAQEEEVDLDKQLALEEARKSLLDEIQQTLNAVQDVIQTLPSGADGDVDAIVKKMESLEWLLRQIQAMDQQRVEALQEERETLRQSLYQVHFGKHAVTTYQKSDLL